MCTCSCTWFCLPLLDSPPQHRKPGRLDALVGRRPSGASFEGGWGGPSPPQGKRKKEKRKKKRKKEKKEEKKKEKKKGTTNNVKLLHIKCCFFQFFNSLVALKNNKKNLPPKKKLKWRPWRPYRLITSLYTIVVPMKLKHCLATAQQMQCNPKEKLNIFYTGWGPYTAK